MSRNNKSISIADILCWLSGCAIVAAIFIGNLLEGTVPAKALAITIGFAALLVVLMVFMIKAKLTTTNFKAWRVVEWLGLGATLVVMFFAFSSASTTIRYFMERQDLKEAAMSEEEYINTQIDGFVYEETSQLNTTVDGLRNYLDFNPSPDRVSPELAQFIRTNVLKGRNVSLNTMIVNDYQSAWAEVIKRGCLNDTNNIERYRSSVETIDEMINQWNYAQLAGLAHKTNSDAALIHNQLSQLSSQLNFPIIAIDANGMFSCTAADEPSFVSDMRPCNFEEDFKKLSEPDAVIISIYALLCLLFLLNFIALRRSSYRPPKNGPKLSDQNSLPL